MEKPIKTKCLADLTPGTSAVVKGIDTAGGIRRRLQDVGLIEGTQVKCVHNSPLGDPKAFLIRGAVIALRHTDAASVLTW